MASILNDSEIVDLDPQGTITSVSKFTGENKPIKAEEAKGKYIIYDTPPYNSTAMRDLYKNADLILIPCKTSVPDLLATTGIIKQLRSINKLNSCFIVFNEVRKPVNKVYREAKDLFNANYKDVKFAKTELSNLVAFQRIFSEPLIGKAKKEVELLIKELNI